MPGTPDREPLFAISVVARLVGLHAQTLRMYERMGLVEPARSAGNVRRYSQADVERLRQVVRMVEELGVNLAGAQVALGLLRQIEELRAELDETRNALVEARDGRPQR
jgi:MerR family transcriptional regulator/heat shock protein HspR